jgi:hypothetical protein
MNEKSLKAFAYTILTIAVVAIVAGFALVGSPSEQRARRFDEQRVNELANIQSQVYYYWQSKGSLPPNLDALKNDVTGFVLPKDPENQAQYEYQIKGDKQFALCAVFNRPSLAGDSMYTYERYGYGGSNETWSHQAGHVCFERTIDPAYLPPKGTVPAPLPVM